MPKAPNQEDLSLTDDIMIRMCANTAHGSIQKGFKKVTEIQSKYTYAVVTTGCLSKLSMKPTYPTKINNS